MQSQYDHTELFAQIDNAIDNHHRTCLLCFHYKLAPDGATIRCVKRQRVWEYADRLSPQHEVKCLHRARNCKTYDTEDRRVMDGLLE